MDFEYDDGGRKDAGYKGEALDCATRAIAIGTGRPYKEVYDELAERMKAKAAKARSERARAKTSPRNKVPTDVLREYLAEQGWVWTPTMKIGSGTTVHLRDGEVPKDCIASVSKHVTAVVDGVVRDTHDPRRGGTRAVYGYWVKEES
jgi:hypothetical protein